MPRFLYFRARQCTFADAGTAVSISMQQRHRTAQTPSRPIDFTLSVPSDSVDKANNVIIVPFGLIHRGTSFLSLPPSSPNIFHRALPIFFFFTRIRFSKGPSNSPFPKLNGQKIAAESSVHRTQSSRGFPLEEVKCIVA